MCTWNFFIILQIIDQDYSLSIPNSWLFLLKHTFSWQFMIYVVLYSKMLNNFSRSCPQSRNGLEKLPNHLRFALRTPHTISFWAIVALTLLYFFNVQILVQYIMYFFKRNTHCSSNCIHLRSFVTPMISRVVSATGHESETFEASDKSFSWNNSSIIEVCFNNTQTFLGFSRALI